MENIASFLIVNQGKSYSCSCEIILSPNFSFSAAAICSIVGFSIKNQSMPYEAKSALYSGELLLRKDSF